MTQRQTLIAHKQTVQAAKNKLKQINGIAVLELFENHENTRLNEMFSAYTATYAYAYDAKPDRKLPYNAAEEAVYAWIIDGMGLKEQNEYFFWCGVWSRIKLLDLLLAVPALWRQDEHTRGFLLAETDFSRMLEVSADSRDESHYCMDIWEYKAIG